MEGLNPELVLMARHSARRHNKFAAQQKVSFVPSDIVAQGGGGGPPGGAPSPTGGGPPPGGPPPSGGGPGGAPPGPPPGPPPGMDMQTMITQAVQSAMSGMGGGAAGPGSAAGPGMKPPKPDLNMVATDVFQMKKLMFAFFRQMGWEPPPDILDGPGRDPATGVPSAGPMGGSDPSMGTNQGSIMGGAASGGTPGGAQGGDSAIQPIQPMDGASPAMAQQGKTASWNDYNELLYKFAAYDLEQLHAMVKQASEVLVRLTGDKPSIGQEVTGQNVVNKAAAMSQRFARRRAQDQEALSA